MRRSSNKFAQVAQIVALLIPLSGCSEADAPLDLPAPGDAYVRFDLEQAPLPIGSVPWPSELYRDDAGRIAFSHDANDHWDEKVLEATRELVASRDGFCTTCNIVFELEGGLSPESLPDPHAEPSFDDAVVLIDVDPDSPELGRMFPLRCQWDDATGWLSVRPARGFSLAGGRRYAAVVTDAATGGDGLPVGPAAAFESIRDGSAEQNSRPGAASGSLEPALGVLGELGLPRPRVRGLATFITDDPTTDLRAIRDALRFAANPIAHVDRVYTGAEIDDLLGIPDEDRPGIDVMPAAGTEGSRAVRHQTTSIVLTGRFGAPRFVEGSGAEVGATTRDESGTPTSTKHEDVPFVLIIPRDADVTKLPVVIAHHGFNASRTTGFVLADTAGRAGFAVLAIDAYQHGDRAASAVDEKHAMRGDLPGADGFAETQALDISARLFGLIAPDPEMVLYPGYALGGFEQFAADVMSTVRLVTDGDLREVRGADASLAGLAFDPERIAFVGNSMGAVVGTSVAEVEPGIGAFVLNVMPGSIVETLAESGEFRTLTETLLLPRLGVTEPFDEVDRAMLFDPTVDLFRWALEPVDPLTLARSLIHTRMDSPPPHVLIQLAGHDEVAAPTASESVVGAAEIGAHGSLTFAPVETASLPLESTPGVPAVAAVRFEGAMHGMLEVQSQTSRYQAPLVPPLTPADSPSLRQNPIEAVHSQIQTFLATYAAGGPVVIDD